ncbi:unnamed protein product [Didymodactylos carnosus]|nr:unnamed protein product [Didymodactylos carnosus]CAF3722714.1 unnamed protein product [Didymodactylos carnosus]
MPPKKSKVVVSKTASKKNSKKSIAVNRDSSDDEQEQQTVSVVKNGGKIKKSVTAVLDKTEDQQNDEDDVEVVPKKGTKRAASKSPKKPVKKTATTSTQGSQNTAADGDDEEVSDTQQLNATPRTMILKTSDRLSAKNEKPTLKFVSWNVNGIRAWLKNNGLAYIQQEAPDIMCFQEMKCDKLQVPNDCTPPGYKSYWSSGDTAGYSGVGLLTKKDVIKVTFGIDIEEHDKEGRVITAEYDKFYFVASYIPNSGRKLVRLPYRQEWDAAFHLYLKKLDKIKPVIWCGDLNVAHQSIDLCNPKTNTKTSGFTKEERENFSKILNDGFIDSYRYIYPDTVAAYTFWSYFRQAREKNIGWRLDYFVISDRLKEHVCDVLIQNEVYGSDHCPIVLLLAI